MALENRESVVERARAAFGDDVAAFVERRLRPCVALFPDPGATSRSRFGGLPDLAAGEEWPVYNEEGQFVAQFDLAELPAEVRSEVSLPEAGLLRLFTPVPDDQEDHFWGDPGFVRALFTTDEVRPTEDWPAETSEDLRVDGQSLRLEPAWDLPPHAKLVDDWPFSEWNEEYREFVEELRPTEHLFGWTDFTSLGYDPGPAGTIPFLTLSSVEDFAWFWHDGDYLQVFITPEALAAGDFGALLSDAG